MKKKRLRCRICRKTFADIGSMGKHYRKDHPKAMKRKKNKKLEAFMDDPELMKKLKHLLKK